MTSIDKDLIVGITGTIVISLLFGLTGIIAAYQGYVITGSILVGCDVLGCMLLVDRSYR